MQQGECDIRGGDDPSPFSYFPSKMREHFPGSNESLLIWAASATQIELSSLISDGGKRISLPPPSTTTTERVQQPLLVAVSAVRSQVSPPFFLA